jgi:hypothetical protein
MGMGGHLCLLEKRDGKQVRSHGIPYVIHYCVLPASEVHLSSCKTTIAVPLWVCKAVSVTQGCSLSGGCRNAYSTDVNSGGVEEGIIYG